MSENYFDGVPTWVRVLQAAVIGVVAGLALNALLSITVLGEGRFTQPQAPAKMCTKPAPAKDAVAPSRGTTSLSEVRWVLEGLLARR